MLRDTGAIDLALVRSRLVFSALAGFHSHAQAGRQSEAGAALSLAVSVGVESLPVIDQALVQLQAAQAADRTQHSLAPFFLGAPKEHPHAANDQSPSPNQPAPFVA